MSGQPVYLVDVGHFLPNAPVDNDATESILGLVNGRTSRARRLTLRNNGIRLRHYAIDPATGMSTHDNAQMTAHAIRHGLERAGWLQTPIDLLVCGTSSPDQLMPGHASMVHAELGGARLEAISTAGVCSSGAAAMRIGHLGIASGGARHVVTTGSELASSFMRARQFQAESDEAIDEAQRRPELAFEQDFLRWMLSDGAGAAMLAAEPRRDGLCLRIDAIEGVSLANELPVCMYSGAIRQPDGRLQGWREAPSQQAAADDHYFAVKQDARVLQEHIARLVTRDTLGAFAEKHELRASDVAWFLPHQSSEFFRPVLDRAMIRAGFEIPQPRWFTNLERVGNVGAAAIYLILDELLHSDRLRRGDRVLGFVPESARFSVYYLLFTVV